MTAYTLSFLGLAQLVPEDAARRAQTRMDASSGVALLDRHLATTKWPLLTTPWILDLDATVKCLYCKQEGEGWDPTRENRDVFRTAITAR